MSPLSACCASRDHPPARLQHGWSPCGRAWRTNEQTDRKDLSMADKAKIGVLGASGYTGAELLRLLIPHPRVEIVLLTAERRAGQDMRQVFPQFSPYALPKLVAIDGVDWNKAA